MGEVPGQVCPQAGTPSGGYTPPGRYTPLAGTPPGRYTPREVLPGRYIPRQVHPRQVHPQAGTPPQQVHTWAGTHPLGAVHARRYEQQAGGTHPNWNEFLFSELKIVRLSCKDCAILSNKSKYLIAVVTV